MLQQHHNKQLLDFLKYSIRLGEKILKAETDSAPLLAEYNERMAELIEYLKANRNGMNLLVSWKIDSLETYNSEKDYTPVLNKLQRFIFFSKKENTIRVKNIIHYINKQNMLLGAFEFYYRHQ
jgi:hypothetical protein